MSKHKLNLVHTLFGKLGMNMQTKLIVIFLLVKVIPLILLTVIAWHQFEILGDTLMEIAVTDSTASLNDSAVKNIERMSTDTALRVADFLYARDRDALYLARVEPTEENYRAFIEGIKSRLIKPGKWQLAPDGQSWVNSENPKVEKGGVSTNIENNDMNGWHSIPREQFEYFLAPVYDEVAFIDLSGKELVKVVAADTTKRRFRPDPAKKDVSKRENTYVKAETYFPQLQKLKPGDLYVSDVVGAYVGSNYIGMYTPDFVSQAAKARGYDIPYKPEEQAYSGKENPNGSRFEGIVRWATPVTDEKGAVIGYVTLSLILDHIMEFVDHITPMD